MAKEKQEEEQAEEAVKEEKAPETVQTEQAGDTVVLIGRKPVMNYVIACLTFFNSGVKKIVVKARGRAISRAVDTIELLKRVFIKDLQVQDISIGTVEVTRSENQKVNVSTIEITVAKP